MPTALTENAANADFGTGLPVPANGDNGSVWCPQVIVALQELADRSQALVGMVPAILTGSEVVPTRLVPLHNQDDRFSGVLSSNHYYFSQASVTDGGGLWFQLDGLPVGRELVNAFMRWDGGDFSGTPSSGLPATTPSITLHTQVDGVDSQLATASDGSANASAYDAPHDVTATPASPHTIAANAIYLVKITGEASTNAVNGKASLLGVFATLGPAP